MHFKGFFDYIPKGWTLDKGGRAPEKDFIWAIMCKLEPEWVDQQIDRIKGERQRFQQRSKIKKPPTVDITPKMLELLLRHDYKCSKYPRRAIGSHRF